MADRVSPASTVERDEELEATVEIDVDGRWHALSLSELLIPFHSYLVQHAGERWVVHARAPGCHGEPLDDALQKIDDWHGDRRLDASIRVRRHRSGHRGTPNRRGERRFRTT